MSETMFQTFSKYICYVVDNEADEESPRGVDTLNKSLPYSFEPEYKYSGVLFCYDKDLWRNPPAGDDLKVNGLGDIEKLPPSPPSSSPSLPQPTQ
mmetsp:Transcript_22084/g.28596  ORF Transcript_22084/g.28596 Transcript_22084/m.28596 type:complete len:95 (-) Transcript_22084:139-423(-)